MQYKLKSGRLISDKEIEDLSLAAERGDYPGANIGEVVMGRPRLSSEPTKTISFKAPLSLVELISSTAESAGESMSGFLRKAAQERAERLSA